MKHCFISDLHLSEKTPELTQAFLRFLDESKEACTHFYILGDLFETWIGDDDNSPFNTQIKEAAICRRSSKLLLRKEVCQSLLRTSFLNAM